jgi:hypothetical protein
MLYLKRLTNPGKIECFFQIFDFKEFKLKYLAHLVKIIYVLQWSGSYWDADTEIVILAPIFTCCE